MKNSILCLFTFIIIFLLSAAIVKVIDKIQQPVSNDIVYVLLNEKRQHIFKKQNKKLNENSDTIVSDAISERYLNGLAAGDRMGYSVAGAGDLNGDGYDDIIAGAPYNDAGATDGGRV